MWAHVKDNMSERKKQMDHSEETQEMTGHLGCLADPMTHITGNVTRNRERERESDRAREREREREKGRESEKEKEWGRERG